MKSLKKSLKSSIAVFLALSIPTLLFAATATDLKSFVGQILTIINGVIPVIFGLAIIVFMWGILRYIFAGNVEKIDEARSTIIFGVIGIAVMISVWGLAFFVKNSFFAGSPNPFPLNGGGSNSIGCPAECFSLQPPAYCAARGC